jgi:hypothetical protein
VSGAGCSETAKRLLLASWLHLVWKNAVKRDVIYEVDWEEIAKNVGWRDWIYGQQGQQAA